MNQTNIEETHNTREELEMWLTEFIVKCNTTQITDDEGNSYNQSFQFLLEEAIVTLHQQLQKAREGEKERIEKEVITDLTWYRIDEGVDEIERGVNYIKLSELREALNHSELDQDNN